MRYKVKIDNLGRICIGNSPDRTCLTCHTGFGLEMAEEAGISPCCGNYHYAGVFWPDHNVWIEEQELEFPLKQSKNE